MSKQFSFLAGANSADSSPEAAASLNQLSAEDAAAAADVAPTLAGIVGEKNMVRLSLFSDEQLAAIEATLTYRTATGKAAKPRPVLRCFVTGKDRPATPEEIVRQGWLLLLMEKYGYSKNRIGIEFTVPFGRDNSKRADIVVFDYDRPNVPYIIVEVKQAKLKDGKEQLKSYCHGTGAPIGVWSDGGKTSVYHRRNPNYFVELPELPRASETIEDIVNEPWTLETLIEKEKARERNKTLKDVILEMEDEVLANAGVDVFGGVQAHLHQALRRAVGVSEKLQAPAFPQYQYRNRRARQPQRVV